MNTKQLAAWGSAALMLGGAIAPVSSAFAGSRQQTKNTWRNGAIAGGAIAAYGLLKGNSTATILGAAGAAYSANRYEQDRKSQSQNSNNRARYHRQYGTYNSNGRKYYSYQGSQYYIDLNTGERHKL